MRSPPGARILGLLVGWLDNVVELVDPDGERLAAGAEEAPRGTAWHRTPCRVVGERDGGVEGDRVWMTCSCGAVLVRVVAFG
jgi:hypothetical protein